MLNDIKDNALLDCLLLERAVLQDCHKAMQLWAGNVTVHILRREGTESLNLTLNVLRDERTWRAIAGDPAVEEDKYSYEMSDYATGFVEVMGAMLKDSLDRHEAQRRFARLRKSQRLDMLRTYDSVNWTGVVLGVTPDLSSFTYSEWTRALIMRERHALYSALEGYVISTELQTVESL